MKLRQLKEWINKLPENELGDYDIVYRVTEENKTRGYLNPYDYMHVKDVPIAASGVDDENKELFLCDEETYQNLENWHNG